MFQLRIIQYCSCNFACNTDVVYAGSLESSEVFISSQCSVCTILTNLQVSRCNYMSAWGAVQVAPYKKVRKVAFINAIPKSAAGKILRRELVQLATTKSRL